MIGFFRRKWTTPASETSAAPSLELLQEKVGYRFKNLALLEQALTHPSYGFEKRMTYEDNQRLEFLGDAVLQLIVTEKIYLSFPQDQEGNLTKLRSKLVNRTQMHQLAESLGIGALLRIGKGEEKNGGRTRPSNLADAMEAVWGAVYRDGGYPAAYQVISKLIDPLISQQKSNPLSENPKGIFKKSSKPLRERVRSMNVFWKRGLLMHATIPCKCVGKIRSLPVEQGRARNKRR